MQKIKKNCHIFSGLTESEFSIVNKNSEIKNFAKWDKILNPWVKNKNLYIIQKWIIKINFQFKDKKFTTWFLKEYDYFWQIWIFSGWMSKIEATCISPCTILEIKQESVDELMIHSPIFVYNLLNWFSENILNIHETIYNLAFRNIKERIIIQLIYLAKIFREKVNDKIIINLPLTQEEISNFVWTSRENITKELSKLKKEWIVEIKTKKIIILDEKRLKEMVE